MNSLIIVVDPERARLYRTGHPSDVRAPVEVVVLDALAADPADAESKGRDFADRIADRAATFARKHHRNPVILNAPYGLTTHLLPVLERELPQAYIRTVEQDLSNMEGCELMRALDREQAFTPRVYPIRA